MAQYDVAHASIVLEPSISRDGRFTLHYTLNDGTSAIPAKCEVVVYGSPESMRVVKGALVEIANSVNHATTTFNLNSASQQTVLGALPV